MRLKPTRSVASELTALYQKALDEVIFEKKDPGRTLSLRCSGLPYCPNKAVQEHIKGDHTAMDLSFAFYVKVGTVVHDVLQTYLPKSGQFIADYRCKVCKKWYRLSTQTICCDSTTEYHEVTVKYKGIVGHIDAIFKSSTGKCYVVDFKTCGIAGLATSADVNAIGYVRQLEAYCFLLDKLYGLVCEAGVLFYVTRDNPKKIKISKEYKYNELERSRIVKDLKHDLKLHKATMEVATLSEYKRLAKNKCGGAYCDACRGDETRLFHNFKNNLDKFPIGEYLEKSN